MGDRPDLGIEPMTPALVDRFFTTEAPGEPYNEILLIHTKDLNNAICSNMDGPRDFILSEVREKDKYHMISLICRI